MKAINLCLNRFDDDTKMSFLDLYTKVDSGASAEEILAPKIEQPEVKEEVASDDIPF
jgi:hypothetical protein